MSNSFYIIPFCAIVFADPVEKLGKKSILLLATQFRYVSIDKFFHQILPNQPNFSPVWREKSRSGNAALARDCASIREQSLADRPLASPKSSSHCFTSPWCIWAVFFGSLGETCSAQPRLDFGEWCEPGLHLWRWLDRAAEPREWQASRLGVFFDLAAVRREPTRLWWFMSAFISSRLLC